MPQAPAAWLARVSREQQLFFELHADRRDISVAEYRRLATDHLRGLCAAAELRIRLRPEHLGTVVSDGRVRNQFETGHSGGYFDPGTRAELERAVLGVPIAAPASERPIYGYLSGSDEEHALPSYGTAVIILRTELRSRATFTLGDSLDQTAHARIACFAPSPLERPELISLDPRRDFLAAVDFATAAAPSHRYAEAQIYGGVKVADFALIDFGASAGPDPALARQLQDRGLQWRQAQ
jgi:hypothetical protein